MEYKENKDKPDKSQSEHQDMGMRGVTKPQMHHGGDTNSKKDQGDNHMQMMKPDQKMQMLHMHHMQTLWVYWMLIILGIWVMVSPLTFSYAKGTVMPSGGREVWLSLSERITAMTWSDIISGALLVFFGWRSLTPNRPISMWICCFIGVWLTFAPIILWSPSAAAYLNDTFVGALVIALTVLIPGMPNMMMHMEMGPTTPPGWSYNPSSWPQRWIMIVLAFAGWIVSRYLSAFQLGYIDQAWDPFFGISSENVLNSKMSHSMPISDAGFGAIAYTIEFLMGWMGSPARWRTMPWMVTFFGILVIPLGLVHIFLVISQPVAVGEWCTLCLLAAAIMLPMIPLQVDEVIAMGQFMVKSKRKGQSLWKVFWMGGTIEGGGPDERSPELIELPQQPGKVFKASAWGMSLPWTLAASALLGIGLVFSPGLLGIAISETSANICHLGGFLIIVVSVISMAEPLRMGRYLNILLGLLVAVSLWFTNSSTLALSIIGLVIGLTVAGLSIPRGPVKEEYGSWGKYVK